MGRSIAVTWSAPAIAMMALALLSAGCAKVERPHAGVAPPDAIVRVNVVDCGGFTERRAIGVAIDDTLIATVAHTFIDAISYEVLTIDGTILNAELVWLDRERDLALLDLSRERISGHFELGDQPDGELVTIMSVNADSSLKATPATVLRHSDATLDGAGRRAALELEATIVTGDSGAPVVGSDDRVIGIVFGTASDTDRGWAIATEEIEAALAQPKSDPVALSCP